ncbi:MAG: hypothetical protein OXO48_04215 [Caldilineaceae bacterium]|nr:hypothetical protein [Caldilineaceae bacterium]
MSQRRAALEAVCRQHRIVILYSFGSRAREVLAWLDEAESVLAPGPSDVDIGAKPVRLPSTADERGWGPKEPESALDLNSAVALAHSLEDLFGVQRVDLVNLDSASPYLAAEIVHGERLYAEDEYAADNFDLYILRQEADLAPLEEERARLLLGTDT